MKNIIEISDFSFKYTTNYILKGLNLKVCKGECLGLLGSNGSGKTTLINCILGELKGEGSIEVLNYIPDIEKIDFKKNIGIVLDNDLLIDYLTLDEYLWFVGKTYCIEKTELLKRIEYWILYFQLEEHRSRIIKYFSHGMRKKTQIISALLHKPDILIVDEPTNGLDIEMIYYLKNMLIQLKETDMTIIISTHNLSFVEEVCDSVAIINAGQICSHFDIKSISENESLEAIFLKEATKTNELNF